VFEWKLEAHGMQVWTCTFLSLSFCHRNANVMASNFQITYAIFAGGVYQKKRWMLDRFQINMYTRTSMLWETSHLPVTMYIKCLSIYKFDALVKMLTSKKECTCTSTLHLHFTFTPWNVLEPSTMIRKEASVGCLGSEWCS